MVNVLSFNPLMLLMWEWKFRQETVERVRLDGTAK